MYRSLKPLDPFGTEKKKVHRFTEGSGEILLLKYYSMKCFTFLENSKTISILVNENYGIILNTCHDTAKRADTRVGFPLFSPDSDDRLSPNFHRFVI